MKICAKCKVDKPLEAFHKCSEAKDGLTYYCKQCRSEAGQANKVHIAAQQKAWRDKNVDYLKGVSKEYYENHKEEALEYSRTNKERIYEGKRKRNHRYVEKAKTTKRAKYHSPEEVAKRASRTPEEKAIIDKKNREYAARKRAEDPVYRLKCALRARVHAVIKKGYKSARSMELVGCSLEHIRAHLEAQFTPEMTWENYGIYWEVDHIRPCASFDLTDIEQQKACFNWKNCQPLERIANRIKQDKYDMETTRDKVTDSGVSPSITTSNDVSIVT